LENCKVKKHIISETSVAVGLIQLLEPKRGLGVHIQLKNGEKSMEN
jgi:hypothetical protein